MKLEEVQSHYLLFLKYYSGQQQSDYSGQQQFDETAEHQCNAHLQILLIFAGQKNAATTRKFYQLQIMHFLVHSV
jgi:hypothetical protein